MILPAIRGYIGETVYYITNLKFKDLASLVNRRSSEELYKSGQLKEALQRSLTDNYLKIKDYILKHPDHFFNAMVLAVYDGDPQWREVRYEVDDVMYGNVGLLELNGDEQIFPLDGQHRLEGIKAALKESKKYENDTIPIMLIGHENSSKGMAKSRRIFSILNRYAKPVGKGDIIALDEDDIVAIVTRWLLENHKLFMDNRIKISNTKSIPTTDKSSFTTLMTLYDCHDELFKAFYLRETSKLLSNEKLKDYKRARPDDFVIQSFYDFVKSFWDEMIINFVELQEYISDKSNEAAHKFRPQGEGGNLFFRPVGILPFVSAVCQIMISLKDFDYKAILANYASFLNRNIESNYWTRILWDASTKKMLVRNGSITKYLMIEMYSSDLLTPKEKNKMLERFVQLFGLPDKENAEIIISTNYSNRIYSV